jgi:hypothetical protein
MGLRLFRRVRVLPGVTLNLSKRGVSVSAGVRGAHVTLNSRGEVTETVGLPGTGVFYTTRQKLRGQPGAPTTANWQIALGLVLLFGGLGLMALSGFIWFIEWFGG